MPLPTPDPGSTALITGASSGIGSALATMLDTLVVCSTPEALAAALVPADD
jgi:NAD(P)-dependent dehydrogenase (short-subunit alcohol dehydrogenase family)